MGGGTAGQYIGAGVGAVVGFFVGGPAGAMYGAILGYGIGGMIDPPRSPEQEIDSQDLQFNTFQRNLPVPIVYGLNKVFGNIIWIGNTRSETHEESAGGKGGGGGQTTKSIEYFADFAIALSEGEIQSIGSSVNEDSNLDNAGIEDRGWLGNPYQVTLEEFEIEGLEDINWFKYYGTDDQTAPSQVQEAISSNPPAWAHTAYLLLSGSLGAMNRLPIISAVIIGIPGGIPEGTSIGSFADVSLAPFEPATADAIIFPMWSSRDSTVGYCRIDNSAVEMIFYLWDSSNGWVEKDTLTDVPEGTQNIMFARFIGRWWTWTDFPPKLIFSQDLAGPIWGEITSDYWGPGTNFKRIRGLFATQDSQNAGHLLWVAYFGAPNTIYLYIMDKNLNFPDVYTVGVGSVAYGSLVGQNSVGMVQDTQNAYRIIVFKNNMEIKISNPIAESGSSYTFVNNWITADFSSYGDFTTNTCWTVPKDGPTTNAFYFIAENNSNETCLFRCTLDGTITELAALNPTASSDIRIYGLEWYKNYLFVSTNIYNVNQNRICGWYDESGNTWTWLAEPSFGSPDTNPKWYSGASGMDNAMYPADDQLRFIPTDKVDGTHTRQDIDVSVQIAGFENSPAASIWDFLTNTRYGMGIPVAKLDQDSFEEVHNYCMEAMTDGTVRYTLDIVLGSHKSALDHLVMMLQSFGGFLVWSEGVIKLKVDKMESSTASLSEDEIISDSLQYSIPSLKDIPNRIKIDYRDRYDDFRHSFIFVNDEYDQDVTGEIRELMIQLHGVTRREQAARLAQYYLDNAITNRIIVIFRVGIEFLQFEVGDVIDITHTLPAWTNKKFRILEISEQEDDELSVTCREYTDSIFHDIEAANQVNTDSYIPSLFEPPEHVVLLDAYEKPTALAEISIIFGLPNNPGWWENAQLFKSVGDNLNYEHIGNAHIVSNVAQIESSVSIIATTINIKNIYGSFPNTGTLIVNDEEITYTGFTDDEDDTGSFTGCVRGQNNTTATTHSVNSVISLKKLVFTYGYDSITELNRTLYFKALSVNSKGVTATPVESAPEVSIIPIGKYKKLLAPGSLEINEQGNVKFLPDYIDCKISYRGVSRYNGYGKIGYGTHDLGYGGGGKDESFLTFQIKIISSGGSDIRVIETTDEYWVYTSATRTADGTDTSADFTVQVKQKSAYNLSPGISLTVNS